MEDESDGTNPMPGGNSAMALFDKYAKLNASIESTRKEQQRVNKELDLVKQQTEEAMESRAEMAQERDEILDELEGLQIQRKELEESNILLRLTCEDSEAQLERSKREGQQLDYHAAECHEMFLETCIEFRQGVKRLKLKQEQYKDSEGEESKQEEELAAAKENYEKLLKEQNDLSDLVESLTKQTEEAKARGAERQSRLEQGNNQLSRIRSDCWNLQDEIDSTRHQIAESEAMIKAYEAEIKKTKDAATARARLKDMAPSSTSDETSPSARRDTFEVAGSSQRKNRGSRVRAATSAGNKRTPQERDFSRFSNSSNNARRDGSVSPTFTSGSPSNNISRAGGGLVLASENEALSRSSPALSSSKGVASLSGHEEEEDGGGSTRKRDRSNFFNPYTSAASSGRKSNEFSQNQSPNRSFEQHPHRIGRVRYNRQFSTALEIMSSSNHGREDRVNNLSNTNEDTARASMSSNCDPYCGDDDEEDDDGDDLLQYRVFS